MSNRSQHELEVQIDLLTRWLGGTDPFESSLKQIRKKCKELGELYKELEEVKARNASHRVVNGVEVQGPLSRSWHK